MKFASVHGPTDPGSLRYRGLRCSPGGLAGQGREDNAVIRLIFALFVMLGVLQTAHAQAGVGAKYGAREPVTCKSKKDPAKGAPTAEQIKRYVMCEMEGEPFLPGVLHLLENVQVEVGKGRPFASANDYGKTDADVDSPVYPIRGSYELYICNRLNSYGVVQGRNCQVVEHSQASGSCYKTTFGDWSCYMTDTKPHSSATRENVAASR